MLLNKLKNSNTALFGKPVNLDAVQQTNVTSLFEAEPVNKEVQLVKFDDSACYDVTNKDFKLEALLNFINGENTLSSLAIAEITGRDHHNVLKKARSMFSKLNLDEVNFNAVYFGGNNEQRKCYIFNQRYALNLLAGYSMEIRDTILVRWMNVETGKAQPAYVTQAPSTNKNLAMVRLMLEELEAHDAQLKALDTKVDQVKSEISRELISIQDDVKAIENELDSHVSIYDIMPNGYATESTILAKYCTCIPKGRFKEAVIGFGVKTQEVFGIDRYNVVPITHTVYHINDSIDMGFDLQRNSRQVSKCRWEHDKMLGAFLLKK